MSNVEKYKEYIEKIGFQEFTVDKNGKAIVCSCGECCTGCMFENCDPCNLRFIDWLCEKYNGPILSNDERRYLLNVIEPFLNDVAYIEKIRSTYGNDYIRIKVAGFTLHCMIPIPKKRYVC